MSSPSTAPQVHASGLGRAEIRVGETVITPASDRLFALAFQFCLRAGEYIPRDELVALLWADASPTKGRHSLRQMLYRLRQMGMPLVDADDAIVLPAAAVVCDVRDVLEAGWELDAPAALVRVGGDLIAGGPMDHSDAYRDWYDAMESRVRTQLRRAALRHLSAARQAGRWRDTEDWALHVLRHDALNEEATLALAESMVMTGSKARALELLDGYLRELGDTAARIGLPAQVLRRRIVAAAGPFNAAASIQNILGRTSELKHGLSFLNRGATEDSPKMLLLRGPAGIGKTRLATEIAGAAQLAGYLVLGVSLYASERIGALTSVKQLARQVLDSPGCASVTETDMAVLRALASNNTTHSFVTLPQADATTDGAVISALMNGLDAIAQERPLLVLVEDIHNSSDENTHPIIAAAASVTTSGFRLLLTGRTTDIEGPLRRHGISQTDISEVHLGPLDYETTHALATALLSSYPQLASAHAERIALASGGNPLFTHALARHILAGGHSVSIPESLERSLSSALMLLPKECTAVAETTALLAQHAQLSTARAASGLEAGSFQRALERLEAEGVIGLRADGLLTVHACWVEALRLDRNAPSLAHRRLMVADYLLARNDTPFNPDLALHAASLLERAGERERATDLLLNSGEALFSRGLVHIAQEAFRHAQDISPQTKTKALSALRLSLCQQSLGEIDEALKTILSGLTLPCDGSRASIDTHISLRAQALDVAWRLGIPFGEHLQVVVSKLQDGRASAESRQHAAFNAARVVFNDRGSATLNDVIHQSKALTAKHGNSFFGDLTALVIAAESGDVSSVSEIDARLSSDVLSDLPVHAQALALRYLSQALRWTGQHTRALTVGLRASDLASTYALRNEASILAVQMGFLHADSLSIDLAATSLRQAQSLSKTFGKGTERSIALWHLDARVAIVSGNYSHGYETLHAHIDFIRLDPLLKRQCSAAAMLAVCAANCNDFVTADDMLALAVSCLASEPPSLQMDSICDDLGQALVLLGRNSECNQMLCKYLTARKQFFPVNFARAHILLSSARV